MTTQASPASIKSRFACKAQPQMQPYGEHLGPAAATVRSTHGMK